MIFVCFLFFEFVVFFAFGPLTYLVMQFLGICLKCGLIGAISSQSLVAVSSRLVLTAITMKGIAICTRMNTKRLLDHIFEEYPSTLQGHIEEYIP